MKSNVLLCLPALLLIVAGCGKDSAPPSAPPAARPAAPAGDVAEAAKGINAFALDLYARLADEKKGENIFFSPYSVSTALSMTYAGARGNTAAEMRKALRFPLDDARLHPAMGALGYDLNAAGANGGFELSVANALWMQKGRQFLPAFLDLNRGCYGAGLETLDFAADPEGARKTINAWVERRTKEKIVDLIPRDFPLDGVSVVLTNAIYFKGTWLKEFPERYSAAAPFKLAGGGRVSVPMMHIRKGEFLYCDADGFQALEMPYQDSELAMLVLLPDRNDGLPELEKGLSVEKLQRAGLSMTEMQVRLPKFKLVFECDLKEPLRALGMKDAFDPARTDLSGMTGQGDLFVTFVLHKAFVDVNEKGTEAAAATGAPCAPKTPDAFFADHPFLFLIRDQATGCVLFMGRVTDPTNGTGKPVDVPPEGKPAAAL